MRALKVAMWRALGYCSCMYLQDGRGFVYGRGISLKSHRRFNFSREICKVTRYCKGSSAFIILIHFRIFRVPGQAVRISLRALSRHFSDAVFFPDVLNMSMCDVEKLVLPVLAVVQIQSIFQTRIKVHSGLLLGFIPWFFVLSLVFFLFCACLIQSVSWRVPPLSLHGRAIRMLVVNGVIWCHAFCWLLCSNPQSVCSSAFETLYVDKDEDPFVPCF